MSVLKQLSIFNPKFNFSLKRAFILGKYVPPQLSFLQLSKKSYSNRYDIAIQNEHHDFSEIFRKIETSPSNNFIRNLLYPETDDELINNLKSCSSVDDVLRIIENNDTLSKEQMAQVVLILRDIQKFHQMKSLFNMMDSNLLLVDEITFHPTFHKLLGLIESSISYMNLNEMTSCLFYLSKMKVNDQYSVITALYDKIEENLKNEDNPPLSDLTRFFMTLKNFNNLRSVYTMNDFIPAVMKHLEYCDNVNNFRHITICLQKCSTLITNEQMNLYLSKVNSLLLNESTPNNSARARTVIKVLYLLNTRYFNTRYMRYVSTLSNSLIGEIGCLGFQEIILLHQLVFRHQEPHQLLKEIDIIIQNMLRNCDKDFELIPSYVFQIALPGTNVIPFNDVKNSLKNTDLKFDKEITDLYWTKFITVLQNNLNNNYQDFFWSILRYAQFSAFHSVHRHSNLEKWFLNQSIELLQTQPSMEYQISNYTKLISIILMLHERPFSICDEKVFQKFINCIPRLSLVDIMYVWSLLREAKKRFKKSKHNFATFLHYYIQIISEGNQIIINNLKNDDISPGDLTINLFLHVLKGGNTSCDIFEKICDKFRSFKVENINSKFIRNCLFDFTCLQYLIPEFADSSFEYCIKKKEVINGTTVGIVLTYCFLFGYVPKRSEEFLEIAKKLIYRDKNSLTIYKYIQAVNALSYFGDIPSVFIDDIFRIEFLQQIDDSSKDSVIMYERLRKQLMLLNRTLCIQYPHRDVPWFHYNYCNEKKALHFNLKGSFYVEIFNALKLAVNNNEAIETTSYSPYGHMIDFVVYLDKDGNPKHPNDYKLDKLRKVAFLLRKGSREKFYFTKGNVDVSKKELEMLNYEVKVLTKYHWNLMYMSEPMAKVDYIKRLLWSTDAN